MTAADDEMREAQMNTEPFDPLVSDIAGLIRGTAFSGIGAEHIAGLIIDSLRRRGAWLPGDPVTDAMVDAASKRLCECGSGPVFSADIRAAITAALEARAKP